MISMNPIYKKAKKFMDEPRLYQKMGLYPYFVEISDTIGPRTMINGKETIMLGSNNYMGLTTHPEMIKVAIDAINKYGVGCTGSRFMNGTLDLHNQLEARLSTFFGKENTIAFTTGYSVNLGIFASLMEKDDYIISDEKNHASIIDGIRLSHATRKIYKHNDPQDLERILREIPRKAGKLVVAEGVYSIEGDISPVPELAEVTHQYDGLFMLDDAHGTGVLGDHGEGTPNYFKMKNDAVDLLTGTFSKSFASVGGFASGEADLIGYIKHSARSFMFSASIPPASCAVVTKAVDIIYKGDDMRQNIRTLTRRFRKGLEAMGYRTLQGDSAIIPIVIGNDVATFKLWRGLMDAGVYTNPYRTPGVPVGQELLRGSIIATHTQRDVDESLAIFQAVGKELKII